MACLSILVSLTTLAWFYYRVKIERHTALLQVSHAIEYARMQAISLQVPMIYCGSSDGWHCDGRWQKGQIIHAVNSSTVLQRYLPIAQVQLSFHANFGHNQQIKFMTTGFTNGQNGRFDFCIKPILDIKPCRSLILHFSGQTIE